MDNSRLTLMGISCALLLTACASKSDEPIDLTQETREAGADAIGLPRERPGPVLVDEGDDTVPTPYGGDGSRRRCSTVAQDIARLTVVLGSDREVPPPDANEEENESFWSRSRQALREAPGVAEEAALDAYHSAIVGLNPVRPVIRFVGRAGEIEREARQQREMALKRRSYLRGLYDGFGCDESYLLEVFEEYGIIANEDQS